MSNELGTKHDTFCVAVRCCELITLDTRISACRGVDGAPPSTTMVKSLVLSNPSITLVLDNCTETLRQHNVVVLRTDCRIVVSAVLEPEVDWAKQKTL